MKVKNKEKSKDDAVQCQNRSAGKENHTGIPTQLKERMEQSTGLSFDDVRVHYNSDLPARLDALAYTQGNQVEIGPGQERHLLHELGHVVQQKLGVVRANVRHSSGVAMNTDETLERQADEIGAGKRVEIVQKMRDNVVQRCGGVPRQERSWAPEAYWPQRKNRAKRFTHKSSADNYYRPWLNGIWPMLTRFEQFAVWQYTHGSDPINLPLSGYSRDWNRRNFRGIGNVRWDDKNWDPKSILVTPNFQNEFANLRRSYRVGWTTRTKKSRNYDDVITELTTGIEKSQLSDDVWLVRGSSLSGLAGLLDGPLVKFDDVLDVLEQNSNDVGLQNLRSKVVGNSFQCHSFMSTSIFTNGGFNGDVQYQIYAPAGSRAIYAEPASYYGGTVTHKEKIYSTTDMASSVSNQAEVIIQRGTTFRIIGIERKARGTKKYIVEMEIVAQPAYFRNGHERT